jgi:long-chain acyl-CoA synthetase
VYETLVDLIQGSCRKYQDRNLFGTKKHGTWQWITYGDFGNLVDQCRSGLKALGVGPGDKVAIIADNCLEWATAAFGTYGRQATFVPMYTAQLPEEWQFILNDCQAKVVVTQTREIYEKINALRTQVPAIERVVCIGLPASNPDSYEQLLATGRQNPSPVEKPMASAVANLVYTSGTTGDPKGVELTHKNITSNCAALPERFSLNEERSLAFLPWAHAFGQTAELFFLFYDGHSLALNDDITAIVSNLAEVRPTILIAVPRIFNRIYESVNRQMQDKPKPIQALFRLGLSVAKKRREHKPVSALETIGLAACERLIFSKVRARFGGRLKLVISGSAALNKDVAEFIDALGIMVYEGYGLSETSPVVSVNYPGHRKIGSVGQALSGVRVTLDETKSDDPGEGEIIVYGPNVMKGYYNRAEDTAAVLMPDGGFRTGDLGKLDAEGYLYITGRIKELYKLENGRYVAPAALEEELKVSPYISNLVICGANRPFNVALVCPAVEEVKRWANENGHSVDDLTTSEPVRKLLQGEIHKYSEGFKGYERPKKIVVLPEDFSGANGLLTPKMSVKRKEVMKRYGHLADALYQ